MDFNGSRAADAMMAEEEEEIPKEIRSEVVQGQEEGKEGVCELTSEKEKR